MKHICFLCFSALAFSLFGQNSREPYNVGIEVIEKEVGQFYLVINIDLSEGSYYASPYADDAFSGKFNVKLDESEKVRLGESFTESPRSIAPIDPLTLVNEKVNWVRSDTTYNYPLYISTTGDFHVDGEIRFVIEPRCTMERIQFTIQRVDGTLVVRQA